MYIALYKNDKILGKLIRRFSRGEYNHASIVFNDNSVIEASVSKGVVKNINFNSTLERGTTVELFEVPTTPEQYKIILDFLNRQLGKGYDYWSVLGFILFTSNEGRKSYGKWFCSELVFASFKEAGIKLLENVEAWKVSPTMLRFSSQLISKETIITK